VSQPGPKLARHLGGARYSRDVPWARPGSLGIETLRRFFGLGRSNAGGPEAQPHADGFDDLPPDSAALDADAAAEAAGAGTEVEPEVPRPDPVPCPYCAALLDPPPPRTRRCPSCRQSVIVRRVEGAAVYLTESAAAVLEAERHREADVKIWTAERRHWVELALSVHAPVDLCRKIAAMPISDRAVEAARAVYRTASDQAVRDAREAGQWVRVSRIRQIEADELYLDAGSPLPPPADILAVYRESKAAVLHSLAAHSTVAELAAGTCCRACRADEGGLFKIAVELRKPRLPHEGCPRGLCGCDWFVAVPESKPARRRRKPKTALSPGTAPSESDDVSDVEGGADTDEAADEPDEALVAASEVDAADEPDEAPPGMRAVDAAVDVDAAIVGDRADAALAAEADQAADTALAGKAVEPEAEPAETVPAGRPRRKATSARRQP